MNKELKKLIPRQSYSALCSLLHYKTHWSWIQYYFCVPRTDTVHPNYSDIYPIRHEEVSQELFKDHTLLNSLLATWLFVCLAKCHLGNVRLPCDLLCLHTHPPPPPPHPPFVPFVFIPPLLLWSYQLTCCCVNPLVTFFAFALINFSKISPLPSFPNDLGGWSWLSLSPFPLKPVIFPLYGYMLCIRKIPNMTKQDSVLQTAWHGSKMHKFNPDEGLWNKHIQHSGHSHITWLRGLYLPIRPFENI